MDELRELDVRVAEALGICVTVRHDREPCQSVSTVKYTDGEWFSGESLFKPIAHYSTDIAAAWGLVERMRKDCYNVSLRLAWLGVWECAFWGKLPRGAAQVSTAPEAICRAFLAATENK